MPNINRPLSKHHEFITAISLQVINIWQMETAAKYHFDPVLNYPGRANKYIDKFASTTGKMIDSEGNYYYVSHPPFAYILPYLVFKLFKIKATVIAIEIFNLAINFISASLIYLIICTLQFRKPFKKLDWSGLCGFSLYLFSAGVLWFQCNTYMSDTLVHLFFVFSVYCLLQIILNKQTSGKFLFYYTVSLCMMIYTSWLGIFFAFTVFLYSLIKLRKERVYLVLNLLTLLLSMIMVGLIVYQYSSINGFANYISQMKDRLHVRSGWREGSSALIQLRDIINSLINILKNYTTSYLPFILLLGFLIYRAIVGQLLRLKLSKKNILFIWVSVLPIILLHIFLLDYSGHDFVTLYGSLFLSVTLALLLDKLRNHHIISFVRLQLLILLSIVISVISYYYINKPGKFSFKGDEYDISKKLGLEIKTTSNHDAVVFSLGKVNIDPQLIYYAERNIKEIKTKEEAIAFLKTRNIKYGYIYYSSNSQNTGFDKIEEIDLSN